MEKQNMENNKWLWPPDKKHSVFFHFEYYNLKGEKKRFVRSLKTMHLPDARKIRDTERKQNEKAPSADTRRS